jgi:Mg2+ and Co2+ transporter CorA
MLEPQDETPWYMWILIIVIILALAFFLLFLDKY